MNFCKTLCYRWSTLNQNNFKVNESRYIALSVVRGSIGKNFFTKVIKGCTIRYLQLNLSGISVSYDFSCAELWTSNFSVDNFSNWFCPLKKSGIIPHCSYCHLFNRDLYRDCLVYMFSLCFSGSKYLTNSRRQFRVSKISPCT